MAHDVFISYSNKDKTVGDAACATLEAGQVRCWIAPRDILPGAPWGESIIDAINACRVMVLIYSAHSNTSPQVLREVERAVAKGIAILPFRIADVPLSKGMEYCISTHHWLDALTPPVEKHLQHLAETVRLLLDRLGVPRPTPPAAPAAQPQSAPAQPAPARRAPAAPVKPAPAKPPASPARPAAPAAKTPAPSKAAPAPKAAAPAASKHEPATALPARASAPATPYMHDQIQKYLQTGAWKELRSSLIAVARESGVGLRGGVEAGIRSAFVTLDDAAADAASEQLEKLIVTGKAWPNLSKALGAAWADRAGQALTAAADHNREGVQLIEVTIKLVTDNPQLAAISADVLRINLSKGRAALDAALVQGNRARTLLERGRRFAGDAAFDEQAGQIAALMQTLEDNRKQIEPLFKAIGLDAESVFTKIGRWWRTSRPLG